jgi:hypothetical protein
MRQLNKFQSALLLFGGLMMVAGAILFITKWAYSPYLFILGSILYAGMQLMQRYEGKEIGLRRLRSIQIISCVFILLAGGLMMFNYQYVYLKWFNYGFYVRNEWVVSLLIGAVLHLYTSYRIPYELEKEEKNAKSE